MWFCSWPPWQCLLLRSVLRPLWTTKTISPTSPWKIMLLKPRGSILLSFSLLGWLPLQIHPLLVLSSWCLSASPYVLIKKCRLNDLIKRYELSSRVTFRKNYLEHLSTPSYYQKVHLSWHFWIRTILIDWIFDSSWDLRLCLLIRSPEDRRKTHWKEQ